MKTIDSLPPEILIKVINRLPLNEIIKCKRICKKWKSTIEENLRLKNLVISNLDNVYCRSWWLTKEMLNCSNLIKKPTSNFFEPNQNIFKNVQSLFIYSSVFVDLDLLLNNLNELKTLEIKEIRLPTLDFVVNLPKLTYLNLDIILCDEYFSKPGMCNFICPNLSYLRVRSLFSLEFSLEHTSSLRHLVAFNNHQFLFDIIKKCSNLEYLYLEYLRQMDDLDISNLNNLKEIQIYRVKNWPELKQKIQASNLSPNLKVYFYGVDLEHLSNDHLKVFSSNYQVTDLVFKPYYEMLANKLPFIEELEYKIIDNSFDQLPADFKDKFFNLRTINIDSPVKDSQKLIRLLNKYRYFTTLRFNKSKLSQNFFNRLPQILKHLTSLSLNGERSNLNLKFIFDFKHLTCLTTDIELECDFLYKLFTETKIKQVFFGRNNREIFMGDQDDGFTFGRSNREPDEYYSDVDEMFEAFKLEEGDLGNESDDYSYYVNDFSYESDNEMAEAELNELISQLRDEDGESESGKSEHNQD